ncbi:MAG: hypothetical protein AW07_02875 [Candidatus Accumulibacter sp. SK-11]|nr:MAG: hypothetical protein AW07_02875 [Candidatus Accumulibacter sp. SK-11]
MNQRIIDGQGCSGEVGAVCPEVAAESERWP